MAKEKEEIISQDFEAQIPEEEKPNFWEKTKRKIKGISAKGKSISFRDKKLFLIIGGVVIISILLIIFVRSSLRISRFKPLVFPSPSPSPYEEEITNPSIYATDSAVLEIGERLKEINQDLDQTDLKETGLNPPVLDMEVNFEE